MDRRKALKLGASSVLTALVAKASGVADFFGVSQAQSPPPPPQSVGERYGDFLILPAGTTRPLLDHEPDAQFIPSLEQLTGGAPPTGETVETTARPESSNCATAGPSSLPSRLGGPCRPVRLV